MSLFRPAGSRARLPLAAACTAVVAAALLIVASTVASAQDKPSASKPTTSVPSSQQAAAPAKAAPAGGSGQRAFIDPKTGKLRQPEPDEVVAPNAVKKTIPAPKIMRGPGGSFGAAVPEDYMNYSVAVRNPDGTISMGCVVGKKAADEAVLLPKKGQAAVKKENKHDK
jgi:hypothetical protein